MMRWLENAIGGKEVRDDHGNYRTNSRSREHAHHTPTRPRAAWSLDRAGPVVRTAGRRFSPPGSRTNQKHARGDAPPHALAARSGREPAVRGHHSRRPLATLSSVAQSVRPAGRCGRSCRATSLSAWTTFAGAHEPATARGAGRQPPPGPGPDQLDFERE